MIILPQILLEVVQLGGGFKLDLGANIYMPELLISLAQAASISGATLVIKISTGLIMPDTMKRIAAAGKGRVIFEI